MTRRKPDRELAVSYGIPVVERSVPPGAWSADRVLEALVNWTREPRQTADEIRVGGLL